MTELPRQSNVELRAGFVTDSPLIAVRMSEHAAEQLAAACRWAQRRAGDEWDNPDLPAERRARAMAAYEWLSWAATWMVHPDARTEAPAP